MADAYAPPNLWDMSEAGKINATKQIDPLRGAYSGNSATTLANQTREPGAAAQGSALDMYGKIAAGQGPSVARNEWQRQAEANQRATMAMAARARGGNVGGMQQQALAANTGAAQATNQQMGTLAAQEQLAALQGYGDLASQMYGQGLAYDQLAANTALQADQNALGWYTGKRGLDLEQGRDRWGRTMGLVNAGVGVLGAVGDAIGSDVRMKFNIRPTDPRAASTPSIPETDMYGPPGNADRGGGGPFASVEGMDDDPVWGGKHGIAYDAGFEGVGAMLSDERTKTGINGTSSALSATNAIDTMRPVSFEYKDGYGAPGQRVGFLAQDLERTPEGKAIVNNSPGGKTVDIGGLAALTAAGQAEAREREKAATARLDRLERAIGYGPSGGTGAGRPFNRGEARPVSAPGDAIQRYLDAVHGVTDSVTDPRNAGPDMAPRRMLPHEPETVSPEQYDDITDPRRRFTQAPESADEPPRAYAPGSTSPFTAELKPRSTELSPEQQAIMDDFRDELDKWSYVDPATGEKKIGAKRMDLGATPRGAQRYVDSVAGSDEVVAQPKKRKKSKKITSSSNADARGML